MEAKHAARKTARFVAELRAGSGLTGARTGGRANLAAEQHVNHAPRAVDEGGLQNAATGRPVFVLGLDSIGDLTDGRVELG